MEAKVYSGEEVLAVQLIVLHRALAFQAKTGRSCTKYSATKLARKLGYKGRTAKQLLGEMERFHPQLKN